MANDEPHTLITGEIEKLPPETRPYFDLNQPLPASVKFFEERKTAASIARMVVIGIGLIVVGLVLVLLGVVFIVFPLVGLVFIFAGGWILYSTRTTAKSKDAQDAGQHTRYGIFLSGNTLAQYNEFGYTLIPRQEFLRVENGQVKYLVNDEEKSFDLPREIAGGDAQTMVAAIDAWGKQR